MATREPPAPDHELVVRLVESVVDYAIFAVDTDGRVLTWNTGAERLSGYGAREIVGQRASCFYLPEDLEAGVPEREMAIATAEGRHEDEGWRLRKDGSVFWADVVITAIRGDDHRLTGFGMLMRDLSERRRGEEALRESEQRFRLLVSSVTDYAIFLLTPEGIVASWNRGAERLKGYPADEIIGQPFSRFYSEEDQRKGLPEAGLRHAREHGRWEHEGWRIRRDGSRFWADVVITALRDLDGSLRGFAKVTRDLTERKLRDDALMGVLEREREAAAHLAEVDRLRSELVAMIAHDLRGPVGVLQSLLAILQEDWDTLPDAERLTLVERSAARAEGLATFVDDAFDAARIGTRQLEVRAAPFDLGAVAREVVDDARITAPDREIIVSVGAGTVVTGDEARTRQVLGNLLSNALKFSPPHTGVEVTVGRTGAEVVAEVVDHGSGIAAEDTDRIFEPFRRLATTHGVPGGGLGLYITRSLVEAQGGRIEVESDVGSGSTFSVALPAGTSGS
jgi:PAS domain S-box-containing protein